MNCFELTILLNLMVDVDVDVNFDGIDNIKSDLPTISPSSSLMTIFGDPPRFLEKEKSVNNLIFSFSHFGAILSCSGS